AYRSVENRSPQPKQTVCNPAAGKRRQINACAVNTNDGRCLTALEPETALRQRRRHEKNQERAQSVIREPLPHLREKERGQSTRMSCNAAGITWRRASCAGMVYGYTH